MSFLYFFRRVVERFFTNIPHLYRGLALVWASARNWTIAWAFLLVCQGFLPLFTVFLTRDIVNAIAAVVRADRQPDDIRSVIILSVMMGAVLLLSEVLGSLIKWIRNVQAEFVRDHVMSMIHEQTVSLDMAHYETPEYYDRLHRARTDAISRPVMLLENLGALLKNGITMIGMAGVILSYSTWIFALLLIGAFPAILVILLYSVKLNQWRIENTADERRVHYYDWILTQLQYAMEVRLFNIGAHYMDEYKRLRRGLRDRYLALMRSQTLAELGAALFMLLTTAAAMAWMGWRAMNGRATLGDVALFYQVFSQGQKVAQGFLGSSGEIYRNLLFLENLFEFLEMKPFIKDPRHPLAVPREIATGISFRSVTFHYPGSDVEALKRLDLEIPAGQIVALMGDNGAGKSTIVKLLCRFYDPDSGFITLDGTDIRDFRTQDYRKRLTVFFQTPVHYHTSVYGNIVISEPRRLLSMDEVKIAAQNAGAHDFISRLPEGYMTVLSKWFGGSELSVGEWQRLSLARAYIRKSDLIVLDEPTSSMDSWAESDWLDRFRSLVAGRTALIITHRFTTAMIADTIHVIKCGMVVESGSHESLVAMGGLYGKSWHKQMGERVSQCYPTR